MAVSFNGCSITIVAADDATDTCTYALRSFTSGGGDVPAIDVTGANSGRRLQLPGLRQPKRLDIDAIAPSTVSQVIVPGDLCDWSVTGNTTVATSGTNWYCESVEVTGSIDEANTISIVLIEGSGAA